MNSLLFAQNYEKYVSGNYHMDLINAVSEVTSCKIYGPNYPYYDKNDSYVDVLNKLNIIEGELDIIIVATNWENEDANVEDSDLHPNICLRNVASHIKKVFFINKEYKKLDSKLKYIQKNKFDLVVTVLPYSKYYEWEKETKTRFVQSHFGINTGLFRNHKIDRKYDFTFAGGLHQAYTDKRVLVKKKLFRDSKVYANIGLPRVLNIRNPIRKQYQSYNIYWAEWSKYSVDLRGKTLLPSGNEYIKLMNQSKVFFSTLSADGILGTRFFEIMATGAILFCPEDDYYDVLVNNYNCIMYKNDFSDFDVLLKKILADEDLRIEITSNAEQFIRQQTYSERLKKIFNILF